MMRGQGKELYTLAYLLDPKTIDEFQINWEVVTLEKNSTLHKKVNLIQCGFIDHLPCMRLLKEIFATGKCKYGRLL